MDRVPANDTGRLYGIAGGRRRRMANRLHERASKNTDHEEAKKQSAMANVFRRLAVTAAKQARNHVRRKPTISQPRNEPSGKTRPASRDLGAEALEQAAPEDPRHDHCDILPFALAGAGALEQTGA